MSNPDQSTTKKASRLYLWVLVGVVIGAIIGVISPDQTTTDADGKTVTVAGVASQLKPIADGFIALIKMMISPIIFCTVVLGIAGMSDMRALGRVGGKAFIYFEVVSTLALVIGLVVANTLQPGAGFDVDPKTLDASKVTGYVARAHDQSFVDYLLHIIPKTFMDAFTGNGDLLQVLLIAILFGTALAAMGERGRAVHHFLDGANLALFGVVNMIMRLAPLGAGAAIAFTIGKYGLDSLKPLAALMGSFYLTCFIFIGGVLGLIAWWTGFSLWRFLLYIRAEILTVLGTSSSESALVPLMEKLQKLGCSKSVVGVVVPAGYSFNLDGTNIYLTLAALFVAQALNIDLTLTQELTILGVAMLTSKGASGVTGAGFVTLAATLAVVPDIPVAGMALILGIDRFMSEARALTNFIGNGVATLVVSRWEKELDLAKLRAELGQAPATPPPTTPA
jgi:aerobic C4-dicarboxylate transport protein